ncbi:hypothetical protein B0H13DRAFT_1916961 [Mycena leptocephala]|nr:hypothetical protein B0H13DRAFT_1916961 [Mycena leptocephala]
MPSIQLLLLIYKNHQAIHDNVIGYRKAVNRIKGGSLLQCVRLTQRNGGIGGADARQGQPADEEYGDRCGNERECGALDLAIVSHAAELRARRANPKSRECGTRRLGVLTNADLVILRRRPSGAGEDGGEKKRGEREDPEQGRGADGTGVSTGAMSRQREKYVVGDAGASGQARGGCCGVVASAGAGEDGSASRMSDGSLEGGGGEEATDGEGELCRRGCGAATAVEDREEACSGVESAEAGCVDTEATSEGGAACTPQGKGRWGSCWAANGRGVELVTRRVFWQRWMVMLVAVEWGGNRRQTCGRTGDGAVRGRRVVVEDVNGEHGPGDAEERKGWKEAGKRKERIKRGEGTKKVKRGRTVVGSQQHSTPIRKRPERSAGACEKRRMDRGARRHEARQRASMALREKHGSWCAWGRTRGTVVVMVVRQAPRGADGVDGNVTYLINDGSDYNTMHAQTNASRHDASVGDERDTGTGKVVWSEDDLEWKKLDTRVAGSGWKLQGGRTFNYKPKLTVSVQKKVWRNGGGNPGIEISFSATEIIDFNLNFSSG